MCVSMMADIAIHETWITLMRVQEFPQIDHLFGCPKHERLGGPPWVKTGHAGKASPPNWYRITSGSPLDWHVRRKKKRRWGNACSL